MAKKKEKVIRAGGGADAISDDDNDGGSAATTAAAAPAPTGFVAWLKGMRAVFGTTFLSLLSMVYFTQGFKSFAGLAQSYFLKGLPGMTPAKMQTLKATAHIPWTIKPLYGLLSGGA